MVSNELSKGMTGFTHTWQNVSVLHLVVALREEARVVALLSNDEGDSWVVSRLQILAGLCR